MPLTISEETNDDASNGTLSTFLPSVCVRVRVCLSLPKHCTRLYGLNAPLHPDSPSVRLSVGWTQSRLVRNIQFVFVVVYRPTPVTDDVQVNILKQNYRRAFCTYSKCIGSNGFILEWGRVMGEHMTEMGTVI
jgi:hypothetical protein